MKNHPLNRPDYGDSYVKTNFDRREIGYSHPSKLEIYTPREAVGTLGVLSTSTNARERHDIAMNLVNTIEAYANRLYELEGQLEAVRGLFSIDKPREYM